MNAAIFNRFCEIAYRSAGIHLGAGKEALVSARVARRQRALGLQTPREYLRLLEADRSGAELTQFLDVITTNYTRFNREPEHFELLDRLVRVWTQRGHRRLLIWSAASSTGEEPYSIAITCAEAAGGRRQDASQVRILATDISTRVLAIARRGRYSADVVAPLGAALTARHFTRRLADGTASFEISPAIRRLVVFKRINLTVSPLALSGPFDLIFCRNVMIYFDRQTRQRLATEMTRLLRPGGVLMTGHAESVSGMVPDLICARPSVYVKRGPQPDVLAVLQSGPAAQRGVR